MHIGAQQRQHGWVTCKTNIFPAKQALATRYTQLTFFLLIRHHERVLSPPFLPSSPLIILGIDTSSREIADPMGSQINIIFFIYFVTISFVSLAFPARG